MPGIFQEIEVECCAGSSYLRAARGDAMTSWEVLYLAGTWVTGDDGDDAQAPEASCPAERGRGRGLTTKIYLKASGLGILWSLSHRPYLWLSPPPLFPRFVLWCERNSAGNQGGNNFLRQGRDVLFGIMNDHYWTNDWKSAEAIKESFLVSTRSD